MGVTPCLRVLVSAGERGDPWCCGYSAVFFCFWHSFEKNSKMGVALLGLDPDLDFLLPASRPHPAGQRRGASKPGGVG